MKYISLSIAAALMLTGCQSILSQSKSHSVETNQEDQALIDIASVVEINQALLVDEAIDVIHPVADANIDLGNNVEESYLADDVWQRIRSQLKFPIPENRRMTNQRDWFVKPPRLLN